MNEVSIVTENKAISTQTADDYKAIAIEWLSSTGNLKKFNENEKAQFVDICCAFGLNPIKKEVYGIKYGDNFNLIVGYESYIKRAERSGLLNGWKVEINGTGADMIAVITIYRKDWNTPFVHEVYFSEYNTGKNLWVTKPRTMLKKVAIAQGFRMCFSETLGGMPYTADEIDVEAPIIKNVTPEHSNNSNEKENKKYTKEQAAMVGSIVSSTSEPDGKPLFTEEEKNIFRNMLMTEGGEITIKKATEMLAEKTKKATSETPTADEVDMPLF